MSGKILAKFPFLKIKKITDELLQERREKKKTSLKQPGLGTPNFSSCVLVEAVLEAPTCLVFSRPQYWSRLESLLLKQDYRHQGPRTCSIGLHCFVWSGNSVPPLFFWGEFLVFFCLRGFPCFFFYAIFLPSFQAILGVRSEYPCLFDGFPRLSLQKKQGNE